MKTQLENVRNVTISTKVSAAEKIALQQISNTNHITLSELIYALLISYKEYYPVIGKKSPVEEKLTKELAYTSRKLTELNIELENANCQINSQRRQISRQQSEIRNLEKKNYFLKEELQELKYENQEIRVNINELTNKSSYQKQKLANRTIGSLVLNVIGILTIPMMLKK
jgi:septal ring factor EnvC (AmiA/AmiB activator)